LVVVDTTARLVAVVPSWELPHLAGIDFDSLDFAIRFAHTYIRYSKCNTFQFEGCSIVALAVDDRVVGYGPFVEPIPKAP